MTYMVRMEVFRDFHRMAYHVRLTDGARHVDTFVTDEELEEAASVQEHKAAVLQWLCDQWYKETGERLEVVVPPEGAEWTVRPAIEPPPSDEAIEGEIVDHGPVNTGTVHGIRPHRYSQEGVSLEALAKALEKQAAQRLIQEFDKYTWTDRLKTPTDPFEYSTKLPWDDPNHDVLRDIARSKKRFQEAHYENLTGKEIEGGPHQD